MSCVCGFVWELFSIFDFFFFSACFFLVGFIYLLGEKVVEMVVRRRMERIAGRRGSAVNSWKQ